MDTDSGPSHGARPASQPLGVVAAPVVAPAIGTGASVTIDLGSWVTQLRGRRLLAVVADIERLVVTLVTSDGQVYTQTLERADIEAGQLRLTFTSLALGAVNLRVVAEDVNGDALTETNQTFTVMAGPNAPVPVSLPINDSSGGSGGGLTLPSPTPFGPTGLDVAVQAHDGFSIVQAPITSDFAGLSTGDGRRPMTGTNLELAWTPTGECWVLRNATEFYSVNRYDTTPGPVYDAGTGEILRVAADGSLQDIFAGINARGMAVAADGSLWAAVWPRELRHLATDGTSLGTATLPDNVPFRGVLVDGSQVWAANGSAIARYTLAGAPSGQTLLPGPAGAMAKDRDTGAIWALAGNRVVKLAANGAITSTSAPIDTFAENPYSRLAVASDGSVWVTLHQDWRVLKLGSDGSVAARADLNAAPLDVAVSAGGDVWVSAQEGEQGTGETVAYYWRRWVLRLNDDGSIQAAWKTADPGIALGFAPDGALWAAGAHLTKVTP